MLKKTADLKKAFSNGAIPTEADFSDLIDSFVPKDQLTDDELQTLRDIVAWWRNRDPAQAGAADLNSTATVQETVLTSASPTVLASAPASVPASQQLRAPAHVSASAPASATVQVSPAPAVDPAVTLTTVAAILTEISPVKPSITALPADSPSLTVPADGLWHALPITQQTIGIWLCAATTVNPRPGYRITNNMIAEVSAQDFARRLVQNVERDSFIPWHTIQFSWQRGIGGVYQLKVRSRSVFGPDSNSRPTKILCRWIHQV